MGEHSRIRFSAKVAMQPNWVHTIVNLCTYCAGQKVVCPDLWGYAMGFDKRTGRSRSIPGTGS